MNDPVRILLVDDHTIFRESLVRLLAAEQGLVVAGHCATVAEARDCLAGTAIDVIVLDYDLGAEAGTDLLRQLQAQKSQARVLMLTAGMTPSTTLTALDAGVAGVVLKHSGARQLIEAIDRVAQGETWWDTSVLRSALEGSKTKESRGKESARELTERQRHVLHAILDGLGNKEIASRLQVSETSVKASIQELFSKAGVRTRSQLVRVAIEQFSSNWLEKGRDD